MTGCELANELRCLANQVDDDDPVLARQRREMQYAARHLERLAADIRTDLAAEQAEAAA